jgi:hypothetical protein
VNKKPLAAEDTHTRFAANIACCNEPIAFGKAFISNYFSGIKGE